MTGAIPSFINKGQPKSSWPEWLFAHAVGRPDPNGSFMIRTVVGKQELRARVHIGAIVFQHKGVGYTQPNADEARAFLAQLAEAEKPDPKNAGVDRPVQSKPTKCKAAPTQKAKPSATRKLAPPKGMPPSIEMRNPGELRVDDSYQRSIDTRPSQALIAKIAGEWDWRMCLPLVVSKRDDGLFVIDGQHRLSASKMRGDIQYLPCCVFVFESVAEEAAMFVAMNRERRAVNRLDDFHAARASGNEDALAITRLIEGAGLRVSRKTGSGSWAPGEVAFTSAISKGRRRYGEDVVRSALEIMAEAFQGERLIVGSPVFNGICGMLGDAELKPDRARLLAGVRTLNMSGWASLIAECRGGTDRNRHIHDFLLAAYADAQVTK